MNDIEKSKYHYSYGISHDLFGGEALEAAKIAEIAIQEKIEREKRCEYCSGENPKSILTTDGAEIYYNTIDKLFYDCELKLDWVSCPICGRKLVD